MFPRIPKRALLLTSLAMCALVVGCAGIPRIDPSGERFFICPKNQVAPVGPRITNAQAPAVYTDSVFPPAAVLPPGAGGLAGLLPAPPQDKLTITPDRVLAPVGSEVILKAGLCTRENFLLTDSKVDWLIARDTVGEIVSLGGRGWKRNPLLPWNKPKKIDNQFGTGYTAKVSLQITRGTADPSDDVHVVPGEAWASITSPVEGTTRITAVAPEIDTWGNRRATATIYWVDVQWTFPQPVVTAGGTKVLTTTVRRHTDGTPIEGWLVRYEVADGSGALSGSGTSQFVEVPTDAQGRASIDITPTGSAGSTTRITTQIIRPERYQNSNAPRLVIANGASTINWTAGGTDYLPPADNLGSPPTPAPYSNDVTPPIEPTPASRLGPKLELEVYPDGTQVEVGGTARFEVVIRNVGDSPATGVVLRDVFDQGLTHPNAPPGVFEIENANVGDISPGDSRSLFLTFGVDRAGELRQVLTATSREGARSERQATINVPQPRQQTQGRLQVRKQGPRQRDLGEIAQFTLSITNDGDAPLTNIEIVDEYDRALMPQPTQPEMQLRNGSLFWKISHLGVGQTKTFNIDCRCVAAKREACSTVSVSAETGGGVITQADNACMEIRPGPDVAPPAGPAPGGDVVPGVTPPAGGGDVVPSGTGPLHMQFLLRGNPVNAGTRTTLEVVISNRSNTPDNNVQLHVMFPAELTPDVTAIQNDARVRAQFVNGELLFEPIKTMQANERLQFVIPCNANQPGVRNVTAEVISQNMPNKIEQTQQIEILGR